MCSEVALHIMGCSCLFWGVLVHSGVVLHFLVFPVMSWDGLLWSELVLHVLGCSGLFWGVLIHSRVALCVLGCPYLF